MNSNRNQPETLNNQSNNWIPLPQSLMFLLSHKSLLGWSSLLVLVTIVLTYFAFELSVYYLTSLTSSWFQTPPGTETIFGWLKYSGWYVGRILFYITSRIISFYLAFLLAFSLTTPGYVLLSNATEKKQLGQELDIESSFTIKVILRDLLEGLKIGSFGVLVTMAALVVSFIPVIGPVSVFLLYTFYSALMFLDYPTSQRGWSLGEKLDWLNNHRRLTFRIGFLPSLLSMIPVLNIFILALLFPILTVHTTLNFNAIQKAEKQP